jgi:adenylate cyclase
MSPKRKKSFASIALSRWYWALAIFLACLVWAGLALALRPWKDADGSYASSPYGLSTGLENKALDLLFQLRDIRRTERRTRGTSEPITIIEIDEQAIKSSGVRLQKWRRDWYARLIERANKGGASVIGLDIFLSEEGGASAEDKAYDQQLSKAMAAAGNVVIASKLDAGGFPAITPLPQFSNAAYTVGFVDIPPDSDGFVRSSQLLRARTGKDTDVSFAARLAEGYLAARAAQTETPQILTPMDDENVRLGQRILRLRTDRNLQLDFRTRTPAFRTISAGEILFNPNAQIPDDLLRDRIVLIGASNIDAPDLFPTPFYEWSALARLLDRNRNLTTAPARTPGVELHATTVATMLFGQTPVRPHYRWQIILLILPLALAALAVFRLRALWGLLSVLFIAVITLALSSWAFNAHGLILPLASTWLGLAVLTPFGLGLRYAHERVLHDETEANRAQVMDIFSRCVSEDVAEELWQKRDQIMSGQRRIVTLIFTDIRSFTTLSESTPSDKIVVWLNDYFSRMHAIVDAHGGHINKFLGDGLMIVFGAPASRGHAEEARAAVTCGLEMLAGVESMNVEWRGTGRPLIKIGVGIHTGEATCGVVGAERRLEYTIIGDTVNLAARLESTTKEYGVPLLASEATVVLLDDEYEAEALGEVKVKGKHTSTKIFAVKEKGAEVKRAAPVAVA